MTLKSTIDFEDPKVSRVLFYILLGGMGLGLLLWGILYFSKVDLYGILSLNRCSFRYATGFYCPGCGGTRAVLSLLQGRLGQSFFYHPLVPYVFFSSVAFMISHVLNILTKGKVKAWKLRPIFFYILIAILLVQWLVKNICLLVTNTYFW